MNRSPNKASPILENPFFHRGPVRDHPYFFGRAVETRHALQMLRKGQSISIVGPRRIGKTSFLFHLCDPETQQEYNLGEEYLVVYVDCQSMGDLDKPGYYQWLWQEVKRSIAKRGITDDRAEDISGFGAFREAMMVIRKKEYRPVILFDEFETIAQNSHLDEDLFSDLRSLVPTVIYAIASHNSLYDLTYADKSVLSSPFFNLFDEIHLGFLRPEEAKEMVQELLRKSRQANLFTEEDLAFVFEIGGYHPFFLQLACYYLFEQKIEHISLTVADYKGVQEQYAERVEPHFRYAWSNLNTDEQEAVWLVYHGKISQLDDNRRRTLERKCLLYNGAIFSSVFADFVGRQTPEIKTVNAHKATDSTEKIITAYDKQAVLSSLEEIRSMIQRIPFAGLEVLGNFEGFVLIEIADGQGNPMHPSEKKSYVLLTGRTYQLRITIQSQKPMKGIFDVIQLTDGQDIERVNFTVNLDCDSLKLVPNEFTFTVRTKQTGVATKVAHIAMVEKGVHTIFVEVFQKNTLIQVIPLELEIIKQGSTDNESES